MRDYITGWRRGGRGRSSAADTSRADTSRAATVDTSRADTAEPRESKARKPLVLPTLAVPRHTGSWVMLLVFLGLFKVSADATHAAAVITMFPNSPWWTALATQAALSVAERYHFAGNRNGFTWTCLVVDTVLTAAGLGLDLIPRFFQSQVWVFISKVSGVTYSGVDGIPLGILALALGFGIAWGGDKCLDLAMGK